MPAPPQITHGFALKLFESLYDRVIAWSRHPRAPWFLGGLSFAESSFFPIPPDVMLMPMCLAQPKRWWKLALLTTMASVLGGMLGYFLGTWALDAVMPWVVRMGWAPKLATAQAWFEQWGFAAVFIAGFSPIPYKLFTLAAGGMGMPFLPFVAASIVGRGGRFFLVGWLMAKFGPQMEPKIRPFMEWVGWGSVVLMGGAYLALR
jgi:membrane protein YqaA with SNARE-associated domain